MKINLKVKVKNVEFTIACEVGEEEKIKKFAASLNRRLNLLAESFPGTNLMTLFLINSIMMEDEITDLKGHNEELANAFGKSEIIQQISSSEEVDLQYEEIAEYIEKLIEKIE